MGCGWDVINSTNYSPLPSSSFPPASIPVPQEARWEHQKCSPFALKCPCTEKPVIDPRAHPNLGTLFLNIFPLFPNDSSSTGTPGLSRSLDFLEPVSSHHDDLASCEKWYIKEMAVRGLTFLSVFLCSDSLIDALVQTWMKSFTDSPRFLPLDAQCSGTPWGALSGPRPCLT